MAEYIDSYEYNLECNIGQGAFGIVYLISSKNNSDDKYAFKVIDLSRATKADRQVAEREAEVLSKIDHENIIKHYETFEKKGALCIMTEYCDRGNLLLYLEDRGKKKLEEARIATWLKQMASGLKYMHDNLLMHRDVKTENVYLSGEHLTAKLGDLGLVKVMENPTALALTFCGSPYYMSPDIFSQKPYSQKTDIWSLGVIIYELATLDRPFDATGMHGLVNKVVSGNLPPIPKGDYCTELINLIGRMLSKNPETRPSATDILDDPFFKPRRTLSEPPVAHGKPRKDQLLKSVRGNPEAVKSTFELDHHFKFDIRNLVDSLSLVRRHRTMKQDADRTIRNEKPDPAEKYKYESMRGIPNADVTMSEINVNFDNTLTLKEAVSQLPSPTSPNKLMQSTVRTLTELFPKGNQNATEKPQPTGEQVESDGWNQLFDLQGYCAKQVGEDLFRKVYDILGSSDNHGEIAEKCRTILGPDRYDRVGPTLLYCKTLEQSLADRG